MITAQFISQGKVGNFDKQLYVKIGNGKGMKDNLGFQVLHLKGMVQQGIRPNTSIAFFNSNADLGKMSSTNPENYRIEFKNTGNNGLRVDELKFVGTSGFYAVGYLYSCDDHNSMVGSNEIIKPGETGTILLKFYKTEMKPGVYKSSINLIGNFKSRPVKVKFELTE
jgi:hypothetical protein